MSDFTATERTQVKRLPKPDITTGDGAQNLDEAFVCHVGLLWTDNRCDSTNFGRVGDTVYLHGSAASRMLRTLSGGIPVCGR